METIHMLLTNKGETCSVYAVLQDATDKMEQFNADPYNDDGDPDPDAPYGVCTWHVQDAK